MSFINKIEDNVSSAYVERKLDPLDKPTSHHESPESHEAPHSGGHRLSDAFMTLKDSIIGDTCHKTGEAFNQPDRDEDDRMMMMDDKRKMSESKEISSVTMEDKIEYLNEYIEGKLDPLGIIHAKPAPIGSGGHRLSDAFMTIRDSIIGDACHKTGEAFNYPNDEKMMEDKRRMSDSKEI